MGGQPFEHGIDINVQASFGGDGLQVLDAVDRATDCQHGHDRILEGLRAQDVAGLEVIQHHLYDTGTRAPHILHHRLAHGRYRRAARQRHAEGFGRDMHGVSGTHARANPRAANGLPAHADQFFLVEMPGQGMHGADENFFDVHMLALVLATGLVAARDDQGGDIQASRRHDLSWHGLVAGGQADHAIELGALDGDLNVVGDEVARGQDVAAPCTGAGDEIAGCAGPYFERNGAGIPNRLLDDDRHLVQVAEAACQLRGGVDHRDFGLFAVGF